ncbi:hypothetical protein FIU82_06130 [Pseudoalteromonas sp. THAF3]|uniref:hypothetical protein n=1 Tax=Pseudoalteromonas sp. THAF3 TaxID=2587843 RepID=UPI001267F169|nr:hypothetical protein [Pseudoalteromonas sp. THAF3]QFU04594.1 hypothetical protein FIU82_06130 [Pseudoalteromonas sp. THAF3]
MGVVTFSAGDKDYISKLNQMSQHAGDTAQLKADTAQIKQETQAVKVATEQVRDQTAQLKTDVEGLKDQAEAIVAGDLVFESVTTSRDVKHGDLLLATVPAIEFRTDAFKSSISPGFWFTIENASEGVVYVKSRADLALKGKKRTVQQGDRFGISPGNSFTFRAISTTELRIK